MSDEQTVERVPAWTQWLMLLGGIVVTVGVAIVLLSPYLDTHDRQREMEALRLKSPYFRSPIIGTVGWIIGGSVIALAGVALALFGYRRIRHARSEPANESWNG